MTPQQQELLNHCSFALGQLRHLYAHMVNERLGSPVDAAKGLLGPSIEEMERVAIALSNAYHEIDSLNRVISGFDHVTKALADKNATIDRLQAELDSWAIPHPDKMREQFHP